VCPTQSNRKYFLFTQPRSDVNWSVLGRACCNTCTSYQLLLTASTFTREPFSANPIGWLSTLGSGRRFRSVVVKPSRPSTKVFGRFGISARGFHRDVTYR